jgi:hypothetical protein
VTVPDTQYEENFVRVIALIAAGILLNLGLFFVLSVFTPLVIGLLSGFFFTRYQAGVLTGAVSALISYSIVFMVTSFMIMEISAIVIAVLIMTVLGAMGASLGVYIHSRVVM